MIKKAHLYTQEFFQKFFDFQRLKRQWRWVTQRGLQLLTQPEVVSSTYREILKKFFIWYLQDYGVQGTFNKKGNCLYFLVPLPKNKKRVEEIKINELKKYWGKKNEKH